jgi:hypothetical protein
MDVLEYLFDNLSFPGSGKLPDPGNGKNLDIVKGGYAHHNSVVDETTK